jgi:Hypervirulence associated proteins TUDOR domain
MEQTVRPCIAMESSTEERSMAKSLKQGDHVSWDTSQGKTQGIVEKKLTSTTKIKGHTAKPTKDDPQYLVKSDKTGAKAAHKPSELKKG